MNAKHCSYCYQSETILANMSPHLAGKSPGLITIKTRDATASDGDNVNDIDRLLRCTCGLSLARRTEKIAVIT